MWGSRRKEKKSNFLHRCWHHVLSVTGSAVVSLEHPCEQIWISTITSQSDNCKSALTTPAAPPNETCESEQIWGIRFRGGVEALSQEKVKLMHGSSRHLVVVDGNTLCCYSWTGDRHNLQQALVSWGAGQTKSYPRGGWGWGFQPLQIFLSIFIF